MNLKFPSYIGFGARSSFIQTGWLRNAACIVLVVSLFGFAGHVRADVFANLLPVYETYNSTYTDYFLTTNKPVSTATLSYGYFGQSVMSYVASNSQIAALTPFRRFFKGSPQLEHFYTTSAAEANFLLSVGYVDEGVEGYIGQSGIGVLSPLYRLSKFFPNTNDLVHKYTASISERNDFLNYYGYTNEGTAGYVLPNTALITTKDTAALVIYQVNSVASG